MPPAVLERIAPAPEVLDAVVGGDDAGDLGADRGAVVAAECRGAVRIDGRGQLSQDAPLGARLAHLARDLGAEHDAPLGRRLGTATLLLVAGTGR